MQGIRLANTRLASSPDLVGQFRAAQAAGVSSAMRLIGKSPNPGRTEPRWSRTVILRRRQVSITEMIAATRGPASLLPMWILLRRPWIFPAAGADGPVGLLLVFAPEHHSKELIYLSYNAHGALVLRAAGRPKRAGGVRIKNMRQRGRLWRLVAATEYLGWASDPKAHPQERLLST
jgi:hypothetical protein